MATYMLSFELKNEVIAGRDHNTRWTALYKCIQALSNEWWGETTAFLAFDSDSTIDEIVYVVKGEIALGYDLVLIRSMDSKTARIIGEPTDRDIFKIMPYLKEA